MVAAACDFFFLCLYYIIACFICQQFMHYFFLQNFFALFLQRLYIVRGWAGGRLCVQVTAGGCA